MPLTPPVFIRGDDLLIFASIADAESWLEPVDVSPDDSAFDAEGRALHVRVRGEVKRSWTGIDQRGARVEVVVAEENPMHVDELRTELLRWLTAVEGSPPPSGELHDLVQLARKYVLRR